MAAEGVEYVAFDPMKSQEDWQIVDGVLYGGYKSLHGIGDSKAKKFIEDRDNGGLSEKQLEQLRNAKSHFAELNPITKTYHDYYYDHDKVNLNGPAHFIKDIPEGLPHKTERVFLGS